MSNTLVRSKAILTSMGDQTELDKTLMRGKRIKEERERLGLSVQELANKVGVSRQTMHDWEKGKNIVGMKAANLFALESVLNVPLHYIWHGGDRRKNVGHLFDEPISEEEAAMGREWGKVPEPDRTVIAKQIHLSVAANVRGAAQKHTAPQQKTKKARKPESRLRSS